MPIQVEFCRDQIMVIEARGAVSIEEAMDFLKSIQQDSQPGGLARQLWDLLEVDALAFEGADLQKVLAERVLLKKILRGGRIAVIAPADLPVGKIRIYQQLAARFSVEIEVCPDRGHALDWLAASA
jgi:hypothetical protein